MKNFLKSKLAAALLGIGMAVLCSPALPDDIDLFTNPQTSSSANPNILIILDNTANWARNDEHFPAMKQGAAEAQAIEQAIAALGTSAANVNIGLMMFIDKGPAGGYVASAIQPMTSTNLANLDSILQGIYNCLSTGNSCGDNVPQGAPYGNIMYDAYNYFKGLAPVEPETSVSSFPGVPPDSNGYTTNYTLFKAPGGSGCQHNYIIFIGNPPSDGPQADTSANTTALAALGGSTTQPPVEQFALGNIYSNLGLSSLCYANTTAGVTSCTATEPGLNPGYASQCSNYLGCQCNSGNSSSSSGSSSSGSGSSGSSSSSSNGNPGATSTALPSCSSLGYASGYARYSVFGNSYTGTTTSSSTTTPNVDTGTTTGCVADTAKLLTDLGCSNKQPSAPSSPSCPSGSTCSVVAGTGSCNGNQTDWNYDQFTPAPPNPPACPANSTAYSNGSGTQTTTTTSWSNCTDSTANESTTGCSANQHSFEVFGTKQVTTAVTTTNTTNQTTLGNTVACFPTNSSSGSSSGSFSSGCTTSDYSSQASNYNGGLSCGTPTTTTGTCPSGSFTFEVQGIDNGEAPTGSTAVYTSNHMPNNANLWAQLLHQLGIADTYTIDVYNAAPSNLQTELLDSMANLGGGKYYAAQNEQAILTALNNILEEIQSVNSTFAAAALPVNATNRAQNQNQVYIGQFRPDPQGGTRWFGNLKRYQIILTNGATDLGDLNGNSAINAQTGFLGDCAVSWWTSTGTSNYWKGVTDDNPSPGGVCPPNSSTNPNFNDTPDGPIVEKGAVSEVLRLGNGKTGTIDPSQTRTMLTINSGSSGSSQPTSFSGAASSLGLSSQATNFTLGQDVYGEATGGSPANPQPGTTNPRPSIHGDVIHSRPLPVNYAGSSSSGGTDVVFYGDNDGPYRAVNAATGQELWSFIAPEFINKLNRQMTDTPAVNYYPTEPTTKDWFFDGSTGLYESLNNTRVWIYPSMRRGGRKIYAFDVSNAGNATGSSTPGPKLLWSAGCPDLGDDTGCTTSSNNISMSGIGQTWSVPSAAFIKGYVGSNLDTTDNPDSAVVVVGGGYDPCEDPDTASPSCGSPKGNIVYVLDGFNGRVLAQFTTARSVAADVSLVDVNGDGYVDYAYVADTGGNIYRINFVDANTNPLSPPSTPSTLITTANSTSAGWGITKIAYLDPSTPSAGRKFLFGPALLAVSGSSVYVAIGSGDREHPLISEYPVKTPVKNRFYVFLDNLNATSTTPVDLDTSTSIENADGASCTSPSVVLPGSTGAKGWYLDLAGTGEETVTSALILEGQVAFSTNTPTSPAAGSCTSLGTAKGYLVNLFNGSGAIGVTGICGGAVSTTFPGGGLPPSPVLAVVPISSGGGTVTKIVTIGVADKGGGTSSPLAPKDFTQVINGPRKGVFWKKSGDN